MSRTDSHPRNIIRGSEHTRAKIKDTFLWGHLDQDLWSKICLDHGASKGPMNLLTDSFIGLFDAPWSRQILDHRSWSRWLQRHASLSRSRPIDSTSVTPTDWACAEMSFPHESDESIRAPFSFPRLLLSREHCPTTIPVNFHFSFQFF